MKRDSTPEFGTCHPNVKYVDRPGAYAIIFDGRGKVAVVQTPSGLHLPGGGSENGETLEQTLTREVLEECGWTISGASHLCNAIQYVHARGEGYFTKSCTYYLVDSIEPSAKATDTDHQVRWLDVAHANELLLYESHKWALRQSRDLAPSNRRGRRRRT